MKFDINHLSGRPKMLHSEKAEQGARELLKKTEELELQMEVLPVTFLQFTGDLEERDFVSYCDFLNSLNGKRVIQMLEDGDEKQLFEL